MFREKRSHESSGSIDECLAQYGTKKLFEYLIVFEISQTPTTKMKKALEEEKGVGETKGNGNTPKRAVVAFADPEIIPESYGSYNDRAHVGSLAGSSSIEAANSIEAFKTETAFTPKIKKKDLKYVEAKDRTQKMLADSGSLHRPNYEDILHRVSIVVSQHIEKCEARLKRANEDTYETGLFHTSQMKKFDELNFVDSKYVYHFVRAPICRIGFLYGIREIKQEQRVPTLTEVHGFLSNLFEMGQLSAECSIVCLIYVERLMEMANVPLLSSTWRSVLLCGMLLASKVWQDLSSWNVEFSQIVPQYSLASINRLERTFCEEIKWDLYISSSAYAKYYFALRSLSEKKDFRHKYTLGQLKAPDADKVAERSEGVKSGLLSTVLSKSL